MGYRSFLTGLTVLLLSDVALSQSPKSVPLTGAEAQAMLRKAKTLYLGRAGSRACLDPEQRNKYQAVASAFEGLIGMQNASVDLEYSPLNPDSPIPSHTWRFYGKNGERIVAEIYLNDMDVMGKPGEPVKPEALSLIKNKSNDNDTSVFLRIESPECAAQASELANAINGAMGEPNRPAGKK
jgi:hypothetical protein